MKFRRRTPCFAAAAAAREALRRGLVCEEKLGVNPFKFGMVGSTDSHTSIPSAEENNFFGKVSLAEPSAIPGAGWPRVSAILCLDEPHGVDELDFVGADPHPR